MKGPGILVTVADVWGSAPREPGAWMIVYERGAEGTIGGGNLEWRAMTLAREMLADGVTRHELAVPLGPTLSQCCGGQVRLVLERVDGGDEGRVAALRGQAYATSPVVALFGAGHVGQAVVRALDPLPCRILWLDDRADLFARDLPATILRRPIGEPARAVDGLPAACFVLVMTHSHPLDLEIVAAALPRADLPWVGLIGSLTKRRRFESQLRARGIAPESIPRLVCPIGIAGIEGKAPAVIAASVAAQLLMAFEVQAARKPTPAASP